MVFKPVALLGLGFKVVVSFSLITDENVTVTVYVAVFVFCRK